MNNPTFTQCRYHMDTYQNLEIWSATFTSLTPQLSVSRVCFHVTHVFTLQSSEWFILNDHFKGKMKTQCYSGLDLLSCSQSAVTARSPRFPSLISITTQMAAAPQNLPSFVMCDKTHWSLSAQREDVCTDGLSEVTLSFSCHVTTTKDLSPLPVLSCQAAAKAKCKSFSTPL